MRTPFVILVGFSTTGKSYFLEQVEQECGDKFCYRDSDKFVSRSHDNHIFNIFMAMGPKDALAYIEAQEREFIREISTPHDKPLLVAAGPFLVIRDGWDALINAKTPFVIHIEKSPSGIYDGLSDRRRKHQNEIDIHNPNFGSWDNNVLTRLENGKYVDVPNEVALDNITKHLLGVTPAYLNYRSQSVDGDKLKNNAGKSRDLIELIISKLGGISST